MNNRNFALRPEAGPVPYSSLTESQKTVLKKLVEALREAQSLAEESQGQGRNDEVDPDRVSRIFFVSGEPGSGKSTLYLALQDVLGGSTFSQGAQPKYKLSKEDRKQYDKECGGLGPLKQSTRWLEQIDLEVAVEEGENLLAAVLVRISRALNSDSGRANQDCRKAMEQLEELANDIGIAWDGNLQARAAHLDPSSYSQEVMSAQRARLGTNQRIREALGTLSNEGCYGCQPDTLFVLPIDDFYLKPGVSLDLLRLLRMISIPRLFFLIMGEQKNMEALFFEKALADWTAVAGPRVFAALDERRKSEVLSRAREMSARYFRKLLPIGQRATIETMNWKEALKYKPSINTLQNVPTLSSLLSHVQLDTSDAGEATCLLDFLLPKKMRESIADTDNGKEPTIRQLYDEHYSAIHILEAMPREVMDLWMCFRQYTIDDNSSNGNVSVLREKSIPKYLEIIGEITLVNIEEQNFLNDQRQDMLRSAFPTGFDTGPVESNKFHLSMRPATLIMDEYKDNAYRKHLGWKLNIAVRDEGDSKTTDSNVGEPFSHLPPRPTAWIILLHDLTWLWNREKITVNLVEQLIDQIGYPISHSPRIEDMGWAWYRSDYENQEGEPGEQWYHYPFPCISTFRQLDRFFDVWNYLLSQHDKRSLGRKTQVDCWIRAGWIATCPDDRYDRKMLSDSAEAGRKEQEDADNGDQEQNDLQVFKDNLFSKYPKFKQFASEGSE